MVSVDVKHHVSYGKGTGEQQTYKTLTDEWVNVSRPTERGTSRKTHESKWMSWTSRQYNTRQSKTRQDNIGQYRQGKARQDKTKQDTIGQYRQGKARQDKTRQYKPIQTRQGKTKQNKTMQANTRQDRATQDKATQDKARQDKTRQANTRQDNTRQDKTMQDSARQYNTYWMYIKRTCFPEDLSDIFCSGQPRKKGRELKTKQNKTKHDPITVNSLARAMLVCLRPGGGLSQNPYP